MRNFGTIILLFICLIFHGQNLIDYEVNDLSSTQSDSVKCKILDNLIENELDDQVWMGYNNQMEALAQSNLKAAEGLQRIVYLKFLANSLNNKGFYLENKGEIDSALMFYRQSLEVRYDIKDKKGIANSLNNIGHLYFSLADYQNAIDYYVRGIKVQEEIGEKAGLGTSYNNLGAVYGRLKNNTEAIKLYNKSLAIRKEVGDSRGQAYSINNIAKVYADEGNYDKALEFYTSSLRIREAANDKDQIGTSLNNIGMIYILANKLDSAKKVLERALKIHIELNDKQSTSTSYYNLGGLYLTQKNYKLARDYFNKSLAIGQVLGFPDEITKPAKGLYKVYKATGDFKRALDMHELYILMKDSTENLRTNKKVTLTLKEIKPMVTIKPKPEVNSLVSVRSDSEVPSTNSLIVYILGTLLFISLLYITYLLYRKP